MTWCSCAHPREAAWLTTSGSTRLSSCKTGATQAPAPCAPWLQPWPWPAWQLLLSNFCRAQKVDIAETAIRNRIPPHGPQVALTTSHQDSQPDASAAARSPRWRPPRQERCLWPDPVRNQTKPAPCGLLRFRQVPALPPVTRPSGPGQTRQASGRPSQVPVADT